MNSSAYLPTLPPAATIEDMLMFYAHPYSRDLLTDNETRTQLMFQAKTLIQSWRPTADWHFEVIRADRVNDWLVWQTAMSLTEEIVEQSKRQALAWQIDLEDLPIYGETPGLVGVAPIETNFDT